jgi:hypothetical protein
MIRFLKRESVWTLGTKKMKLKTEVKIKSQGSDNKKPQSFGGV